MLEPTSRPHMPRCFISGLPADFSVAHMHTEHGFVSGTERDAYVARVQRECSEAGVSDSELRALQDACKASGEAQEYCPGISVRTLQLAAGSEHMRSGGVCFLYENCTAKQQLEEKVQFTLVNMEIVGEKAGASTVKVVVPPGGQRLLVLKRNGVGLCKFECSKAIAVKQV